MARKIDGLEQVATAILRQATAVHPLVQAWKHRITTDPTHTGSLPTYDEVTTAEWDAIGHQHIERDKERFTRDGNRLAYPLPHDHASDLNEIIQEYWEDIDEATMFLARSIVLNRQDAGTLIRDIERYHEWVVRIEHQYGRDVGQIEG